MTQTHYTEEIVDSVHSLEGRKQGYYQWKEDNVPRHKIDMIEQEDESQLNQSVMPGNLAEEDTI